jgi:hypothetical protein
MCGGVDRPVHSSNLPWPPARGGFFLSVVTADRSIRANPGAVCGQRPMDRESQTSLSSVYELLPD